MNFWNFKHTVY